jgi:hypothetical protein
VTTADVKYVQQITNRGSHICGELKTKARPLIKKAYDLRNLSAVSGDSHRSIQRRKKQLSRMKSKVEDLLEDSAFVYKASLNCFLVNL